MGDEEEFVSKNNLEWTSVHIHTVESPNQKDGDSTEIIEEIPPVQQQRRQNLKLEIPSRNIEDSAEDFVRISIPPIPSPTPKRVNFSPTPSPSIAKFNGSPRHSASKGKSSIRSLIPKLSFKYRNTTSEIEKAAMLALGESSERAKPRILRTFSFSKLFTPKMNRTSSLPVTPIAHSNPESMHGRDVNDPLSAGEERWQKPIHRSHSVPVLIKDGSNRQVDALGVVFRVIPTTPRIPDGHVMASNTSPTIDTDGKEDDDGENIPEEEAVCRICLVELGEGGDTLKMECSCKGELALAHQECAVKWFSIKGNRTCDVCKQEVKNLPVTLLRIQNSRAPNSRGNRPHPVEVTEYRVWQDVPVLVIVSMLAYFCFLEQLLVTKMGSGAIAISLPFSCILGLLASMTSTTMVKRKYVWIYATIQFGLVVLFAHLFYSLLKMQAVLSVLLATFVGFGVTMSANSVLLEFLRWRQQRALSSQRPNSQEMTTQTDRPPETAHPSQTEPSRPETVSGDSGTLRVS